MVFTPVQYLPKLVLMTINPEQEPEELQSDIFLSLPKVNEGNYPLPAY
jgi:hypothetical protein